jgi:hypothetical protein
MRANQTIVAQIIYVYFIAPNYFCATYDIKINGRALGGIKSVDLI